MATPFNLALLYPFERAIKNLQERITAIESMGAQNAALHVQNADKSNDVERMEGNDRISKLEAQLKEVQQQLQLHEETLNKHVGDRTTMRDEVRADIRSEAKRQRDLYDIILRQKIEAAVPSLVNKQVQVQMRHATDHIMQEVLSKITDRCADLKVDLLKDISKIVPEEISTILPEVVNRVVLEEVSRVIDKELIQKFKITDRVAAAESGDTVEAAAESESQEMEADVQLLPMEEIGTPDSEAANTQSSVDADHESDDLTNEEVITDQKVNKKKRTGTTRRKFTISV